MLLIFKNKSTNLSPTCTVWCETKAKCHTYFYNLHPRLKVGPRFVSHKQFGQVMLLGYEAD
jgi:hypothetical protein